MQSYHLSKLKVWKRILLLGRVGLEPGQVVEFFFKPPTLLADSSAVLWLTETHSTSLQRSKPPQLIQSLSKILAALLWCFVTIQSTLISIVLISRGAVFVGPICIIFLTKLQMDWLKLWVLYCFQFLGVSHVLYIDYEIIMSVTCFYNWTSGSFLPISASTKPSSKDSFHHFC